MIRSVFRHIETTLIVVPALAAIGLVASQAFARYFYHPWMVDWADEVVVYLLIWAVLLPLGRVTAEGKHVHTELLIDKLGPDHRRLIEIVTSLIGIVFLLLLGWYGYKVAAEARFYGDRTASSLRFPIWIYYTLLPIACLGMAVGFVIRIRNLLARPTKEEP
ncbi:MAG: TRAP transporter small permease [Pseudorhodobacter sp.]